MSDQVELDNLNQTVLNLQVKYPDAKLTLRDKRPEVMDTDEIGIIKNTYQWNEELNGTTTIINESTGK